MDEQLVKHPWIWRGGETLPDRCARPTGYEALDRYLPGGGWPGRGLTEIVIDRYGIGELSLLMPALAQVGRSAGQGGGWIVWIAPPFIPYAPALRKRGVDLSRVLLVHRTTRLPERESLRPPFGGRHDSLWAIEQALRSGSCTVVLAWVQSADETALRRLQLAAEEGPCWAVLFRPPQALRQRSPAALRVRLMREGGSTRVKILKCRGGRPGVVAIRLEDQNEVDEIRPGEPSRYPSWPSR